MTYFQKTLLAWIGVVFLIGIFLTGLVWANSRYTKLYPGGIDFLIHWMGTKSYFSEGISPYSGRASQVIYSAINNKPTPSDIPCLYSSICSKIFEEQLNQPGIHNLYFLSPLYNILIYLPFLFFQDMELGRAIWMTLLEIALACQVILAIRMLEWKPGRIGLAALLLFSQMAYFSAHPIADGNAVILTALCITGSLWALQRKSEELAGVLLAFSMIRPHIVFWVILFIVLWCIRYKHWRVIIWFTSTLFLLCAVASLLMVDWFIQEIQFAIFFLKEYSLGFIGDILTVVFPGMGVRIGLILYGILLIILVIEWTLALRKGSLENDYRGFLWTVCLTLVISQILGIRINGDQSVMLFPVLIFTFAILGERWKTGSKIFMLIILLLLWVIPWIFFIRFAGDTSMQNVMVVFILPAYLLVMLYWVRWWAAKPQNLWFDKIYFKENPKH
jgi:hypothetical protein